MPDIQLLQTKRISERVPGAQISNAGATANALQQIGGQVENFALELHQKRKNVESKSYALDSKIQFEREYKGYVQKKRAEYGTDYKGFLKDIEENGNSMRQKYLDNAPYQQARDEFDLDSKEYIGNTLIRQDSEIFKEQAFLAKDTKQKLAVKTGLDFQDNPLDPNWDLKYRETLSEMDDSEVFTPEESVQMRNFAQKTMREGLLNGYHSKGNELGSNGQMVKEREFYRKGIEALRSKHPLFQDMDPDERRKYETMFESGLRVSKERSTLHTTNKVSAFLSSGTSDPSLYASLVQEVKSDPNLDSFKKEEAISKLSSKFIQTTAQDSLWSIPPEERDTSGLIERMTSSIKDPYLQEKVRGSGKKLDAILSSIDEKRRRDLPAVVEEKSPVVAQLAASSISGDPKAYQSLKLELDSYYQRFGVDPGARKYTTPSMREHFKTTLDNASSNNDYRLMNELVGDIRSMAGKDAVRVMSESKIPAKYAVAADTSNPSARLEMIRNVVQYGDNKKSAQDKGLSFGQGVGNEDSVPRVREEFQKTPFALALRRMGGNGGVAMEAAYTNQIEANYVAQYARTGKADFDEAMAPVFGSYQALDVGRHAVLTPKEVPASSVENFLHTYSSNTVDYVKDLSVHLPEGVSAEAMNEGIADEGLWITSPDKSGLELWAPDPNGTGKLMRVTTKTKTGKLHQVRLSWADIASRDLDSVPEAPSSLLKKLLKGKK